MFTKRSLFLKKHTRRVVIFKHALPVFAFALAAIIIVWPLLTPDKERFDLPIQKSDIKTPSVDMENIRFFAQDEKNRIISVKAKTVKEIDAEHQIAKLEQPIGTYTLTDGDVLTSQTSDGLAYQQEKYFLFEKQITTTTKSGYTATNTNIKATYDGIIDSDDPVTVKGPAGNLKAQGILLKDKGNLIIFKGKTNTTIKTNNKTIRMQTTNGLTLNRTQKTLTGKQNIRIQQEENILTTDTVILYYTESKHNRIRQIEAIGNVVLENGKNKIMGDKGIYNPLTQEMVMQGNVRLYQGTSFVESEQAVLNMKTGESRLITKETNGRIKGTLSPNDLKQQDK